MVVQVPEESGMIQGFREMHPFNLPLRPSLTGWIEAHRTNMAAMIRVGVLRAVTAERNHHPRWQHVCQPKQQCWGPSQSS